MQIGQLLFSYLEVPLFRGKPRKAVLRPIADKILSKFAKWKSKSLSLAGRATLIRSVIIGSFVHSFMIYKWHSSLLSLINRKLRNFLWTGSCEETKLVRVAWDRCCRPYSHGGFGLKDLRLLNDSLLRKFTWKFITSYGFAFSFLQERIVFAGPGSSWLLIAVFVGLVVNLRITFFFIVPWRLLFGRQFSLLSRDVSLPKLGNPSSFSEANRLDIGYMHNCMDDLLILRRFGLQGRPSKAPVIKSVIWSPSAPSWIKVNTDGATIGSLGFGGCGGIFRNCRAFVKGCFAIPLGQVFAFEAELLTASLAINFAWKYGWHRLWLESDSSYVVQLLSSRSEMVPWRVHQAWQRCIFQISQIDFQVSHIFKEGNQVADTLSKHALELLGDSWWFSAPPFCSTLVGNDYKGRESFRFS
ncbi:hypothetical protein LWI28_015585 [Acer negundo]|uniref:RNase H type-1 domain-containing protein n=1 Tax=Acer negundo TaxID=4023 RepID=A0AAD5IZL9_ACENE|nr:hypothetical protein LWI28_015585 [Acer negundo]